MSLANTTWVIDSTKSFTNSDSWSANGSFTYQETAYTSFYVRGTTITLMGTSSSSTPSESPPTPPRLIPICSNGTWTISAPFTVNSVTSNEDKLETLLQTYASQ